MMIHFTPLKHKPHPDGFELLKRLIDDLEHEASLGHKAVAIEPTLSGLRAIRDRLELHCPTFEKVFL